MAADHRPSQAVQDSGTANPLNGSNSNPLANSKLWHIVVVPQRELSLNFYFCFFSGQILPVSPRDRTVVFPRPPNPWPASRIESRDSETRKMPSRSSEKRAGVGRNLIDSPASNDSNGTSPLPGRRVQCFVQSRCASVVLLAGLLLAANACTSRESGSERHRDANSPAGKAGQAAHKAAVEANKAGRVIGRKLEKAAHDAHEGWKEAARKDQEKK
jgi:hypothetical protein